jgi:hypothetical protein
MERKENAWSYGFWLETFLWPKGIKSNLHKIKW